MKRFRRWFLVTLFFLLGMEVLTIAPKRLGKSEEIRQKEAKRNSSIATTSQVMRGVKLVKGVGDIKEWEMEAETAQGYKDRGTWNLQGVTTRYFGAEDVDYKVTGERGNVQLETRDMEIEGKVLIQTSDGYEMKTHSVKFNSKNRELTTEDPIYVDGPKSQGLFVLTAVGFKADMATNKMYLRKDVKATRAVAQEKEMNIKSSEAEIEAKTNVAHFKKNVQVDIESVRMTGDQADFIYDQKKHVLESMILLGDVRVTDREHLASCEKAQVIFDKNEFILSGNPKVIQDDNELRGEEIRLINGGKEVKVLKAKARVEDDKGNL